MECGKTCCVIYLSLILMTAGFGLTLMGWFAPPMNKFVLTVRTGGPVTLLIGSLMLLCSCFMCAVEQGNCCLCCYQPKGPCLTWLCTGKTTDRKLTIYSEQGNHRQPGDSSVVIVNDKSMDNQRLRLAQCPSAYQAVAQQEWINITRAARAAEEGRARLAEEEVFSDMETSDDEQLK